MRVTLDYGKTGLEVEDTCKMKRRVLTKRKARCRRGSHGAIHLDKCGMTRHAAGKERRLAYIRLVQCICRSLETDPAQGSIEAISRDFISSIEHRPGSRRCSRPGTAHADRLGSLPWTEQYRLSTIHVLFHCA